MKVRSSDEGWELAAIDPLVADLLRMLPDVAATDDEAVQSRIFPSPLRGNDAVHDPDAAAEWREYVEPELRALFQSHLDIVAADLATVETKAEESVLRIPADHGRAWIHTLNQARLALGAQHEITEGDSAGRRQQSGEKAFALMQIDFYAMILSLLLSRTEL